jgi:hypothetical protein
VLLALRAETPIVAGEDAVGRSLTALRAAQEQSAANATFRDLAGRQENA